MVTELKVLRIRKGLNQEELAKQLNVTRNSVSAWERGAKPSLDNAKKIADFFEVPINEIFFEKKYN
ncbi:helix-turn-helix transcriptional regulator [Ligilactobacillus murinus]|uniref:helix-turn-helix transcriptional regulator n=1 Tax=Ligilactobacillus murinus TaxID=1622 RepID=UPI00192DB019|nr:helix-turn-helix transcriptional regulator [Ligilactobacillus murinus]